MRLTGLIALAGLVGHALSAPNGGQAPTAIIDAGVVIGTATSVAGASATIVNKFLGIPFAASPTRFAPAVTPTPWSQPYDATNFSLTCPQQFNYPEASRQQSINFYNQFLQADEGEDCLNLNIWAPASSGSPKTVMVWIYGGNLQFGSNALRIYDGTSFAANQDVVLVAINYRTNIYGFPNAPQLPLGESNLGFLDQRLALAWIQRNIHAFGGDPSKVTIFGESAGAASVDLLVLTHPTNPPFSGAITQSGTAALYSGLLRALPESWTTAVEASNCSTAPDILACMRAVPRLNLTNTIERLALPFRPVIDNTTTPSNPETYRVSNPIAPVPVLTGTNANEGRIFALPYLTATSALPFLQETYGLTLQQAQAVLSLYPPGSPQISTPYDQISQLSTDFTFTCPSGLLFNHTASLSTPSYRYIYNASFPNTNPYPGLNLLAYHGAEIVMVFGTYPQVNATEPQKRLGEYMQTSWATFARNPAGGPGWGDWPEVRILGADEQGVGVGRSVGVGEVDAKCAIWEPVYRALGVF